MKNKTIISASIVLYKEDINELQKTVNCFLSIPLSKKLFLIDNSPKSDIQNRFKNPEIEYISNGKNIGFGAAHNKILLSIENRSKYHLILNPDVTFEAEGIQILIDVLSKNENVSMIAPKVVFPSGDHQFSCRRYPSTIELLARRLGVFKQVVSRGVYKDIDTKTPFNPEYITGCFQLYKTKDFVSIKGFDERYFLYMEDVDICKKIDAIGKKKLYYPKVTITHILKQGSSKSIILFFYHLKSAIKYFLKWR